MTPLEERKRVLRARHQVHGLDVRRELPVQVVHLELPLEVGDRAQALHHRPRAPAAGELDHELGEDLDLDVRVLAQGVLEELDALLDREERLLVPRLADDADDDALEDPRGPHDDVQVAVRDRVVGARADRGDRLAVAHGASKTRHSRRAVAAARPHRQRQLGLLTRVGLDDDEAVGRDDGREIGGRASAKALQAGGKEGRSARDRTACRRRVGRENPARRRRGEPSRLRSRACRGSGRSSRPPPGRARRR